MPVILSPQHYDWSLEQRFPWILSGDHLTLGTVHRSLRLTERIFAHIRPDSPLGGNDEAIDSPMIQHCYMPLQPKGNENHTHQFGVGACLALSLRVRASSQNQGRPTEPQRPNFKNRKVRMDTMKKTLVLLACVLALALGASAQQQISFSNLPLVSSPTLLPSGYSQLNWSNFFYVDPLEWSGAGPGYKYGPDHGDVAFIGEQHCLYDPLMIGRVTLPLACFGTISSA